MSLFKHVDRSKIIVNENSDKSPETCFTSVVRVMINKNKRPSIKFIKRASRYFDSTDVNFDSEITGIYIVVKGVCKVVNRFDNYEVCEVLGGDCFGECEPLKLCDYTYFGDIYAKKDTELIYISYEDFQRIPLFEIEKIIPTLIGRNESVLYTVSRKYKTKIDEQLKY